MVKIIICSIINLIGVCINILTKVLLLILQ